MKIVVYGDIHGRWTKVNNIARHENAPGISTGDLGNYNYGEKFPLWFTPGNHDSEKAVSDFLAEKGNIRPIEAGKFYCLEDGAKFAGLPGIFSEFMFNNTNLPNRPRKYFSRKDIEAMQNLNGIDILIFHEAPCGIGLKKNNQELGSEIVRELIAKIQPKIAFCGHHHLLHASNIGNTKVFCLPQPNRAYMILETSDFSVTQHLANLDEKLGYQYQWEAKP